MVEKARTYRSAFGRAGRALAASAALVSMLAAQPAQADWKADVGKLRIGMVAKPGAGAMVAGVASLERAYSRALGFPVAIFVARDFPALIDAQASGRVDYAIYSATAYVVAARFCGCIEPIAAPVSLDGATGTRSVIIVRAGSEPETGALRIGIAGEGELPLALLSPAVANASAPRPGFISVPVADAQEAESLFVDGKLDGLVGWAPARDGAGESQEGGSFERLARRGLASADIEVAWASDAMRFGPHAIRADVPADLKDALRRFLVGLKASDPDVYDILEEERQGGFAPVSAADYAALGALLGTVAGDEAPIP